MSRSKCRIRRDDTVVVIAGKDKGTRGRVLKVLPEDGRVVVEGVNKIKRHQKPVGEQPGGIIEREAQSISPMWRYGLVKMTVNG